MEFFITYNTRKGGEMEEKVAIIGIFIKEQSSIRQVNELLHEYAEHIIGRMGVPYKEKSMNIVSIIINADTNTINALSGKLGKISGITAKAMQTNVE